MTVLRVILGDQLSKNISSLHDADKESDIILLCEVNSEATYVQHHKKKIAFIFSAMRHFAKDLISDGFHVVYTTLDDEENAGSFSGEIMRCMSRYPISRIVVTEPSEYRVLDEFTQLEQQIQCSLEIKPDLRFFCSKGEFFRWSSGKSNLRMEYFYRDMRKKHHILMSDEHPEGGQWNYDSENRKLPPSSERIPEPFNAQIDDITRDVMDLVSTYFPKNFGDIEPFFFAVTREEALEALRYFISNSLSRFGDYQDAMIQGEPWMFHSHISFYINIGLLDPKECVEAVEKAYHEGKAPLNSVEGFIRQILGWREFVRGVYWLKMPHYKESNYFLAERPLPEFFWTADTSMNCLKQCITETKRHSYAHHIQRLMILGNFALLAGIRPEEVSEWFLIVYADAYEWVELPNVVGMALFADGGFLASKPYASGGGYINKMSNYCKACSFNVAKKNGPEACPFNYLYWEFLAKNRVGLSANHRLKMMYKLYDRMPDEKKQRIKEDSNLFFDTL